MNNQELSDNRRFEIKSVIHTLALNDFLFKLQFNLEDLNKSYDDRVINNLYFDDILYSLAQDHINGAELRKKVRIRWYGNLPLGTSGEMQIKWKRNYFNWKKNYPLSKDFYFDGNSWSVYFKKLLDFLPIQASTFMKLYPRPTLMNRYKRKYFETKKDQIRITIDNEVTNWPQLSLLKPNLTNSSKKDELVIIEIKIPVNKYDIVSEKLDKINIFQRRHSKYLKGLYTHFPT